MNKFNFTNNVRLVCTLLIAGCISMFSNSVFAQSDAMQEAKKRQTKMMQTQMFMQQLMQLGYNAELRKELEVVEDQVEAVKELAQDYQKEMMEFHLENRELGQEIQKLHRDGKHAEAKELTQEHHARNSEFSDRYMEKAQEVLLPHQIERLNQIAKQQRAKFTNQFGDEFGTAASFADELGLSAGEKKRLIDSIKEARKEYYATVKEAKSKAKEKIMSSLTAQQQQKLNELLGDEFNQEESIRKMREEAMKKQREMMKNRSGREADGT